MQVTLMHPDLAQSISVDESQVPVLEKSGWRHASDETAESGAHHEAAYAADNEEE